MLELLREKGKLRSIAIFPEGTRTLDGKLNAFYRGFIHLLRATENDILPVTLNGFYKLKPKNRFSIDFGSKLEAVIHSPLNGKEMALKTDKEILDRVTEIIESVNTDLDNDGK